LEQNKLYPLWTQDFGGEKFVTSYERSPEAKWYYAIMYGPISGAKFKENGIGDGEIIKIYNDYQQAVMHLDRVGWKYYISAGWIND